MKLYIPALGDELELTKDWTFDLYAEDRNLSLIAVIEGKTKSDFDDMEIYDAVHPNDPYYRKYVHRNKSGVDWSQYPKKVTIPAPATLIVDRIYIRKGAERFNSITFRVKSCYDPKFEKCRFWAKLDDVNTLEVK